MSYNTNPSQGLGEDRRLTAEIFMMLQNNDHSGLNQDVVNAVMQDRQAPADMLEDQHHQRLHQMQLLQQQEAMRRAQQQQHQQHHGQHNLWEQQQQQHSPQYQQPLFNDPHYQQHQQVQYDQYGQPLPQQQQQYEQPQQQQPAISPVATKKPKKKASSKKKSPSKKQQHLPTGGTPANAAANAVMGVVADAAAVATAAAAAQAVPQLPKVEVPTGPPGMYSVGTFVTKHFLFFGWFKGRIIHYDFEHKLYKVQYEDSDLEELTEDDITKLFERAERAKPRPEQSEEMRRRPKRRARYQEGTKIKKLFYGFGWFVGTIESYDDEREFYTVVYEDGDKEELDEEEVFDILMDPRNHKKPRAWTPKKLTKKEKEEYKSVTFDPIMNFWLPIPPPPPPPPPPAKYPNGTEVYKFFPGHGWYKGKVIDYDPSSEFYAVKYEDGDEEDLENHDIDKSLAYSEYGPIGKYSVGKWIKKYFPSHGLFEGRIVRYDHNNGLYKIQYEDKDKEDLDEKELEKLMKRCKKVEDEKKAADEAKAKIEAKNKRKGKVHYL